jgi:hypothetical protein
MRTMLALYDCTIGVEVGALPGQAKAKQWEWYVIFTRTRASGKQQGLNC